MRPGCHSPAQRSHPPGETADASRRWRKTASTLAAASSGEQLDGLRERLVEHHDFEEKGGLFQGILEALPTRRVEIDRLALQHERMIQILEMARLHAQNADVSEADALCVDLVGFLQMFRDHEAEEERLLREALDKDRSFSGST